MRLRNEIFLHVLDWLHHNKGVRDQAHLASIIGINAASMSRIMTGRNEPSEDTLRKLNEAFGNIFNMKYLRGLVPYPMLVEDEKEPKQTEPISVDPGSSFTVADVQKQKEQADIITDLLTQSAKLITENESIRRQLLEELTLLQQLRQDYTDAIQHLNQATAKLTSNYFPFLAAEPKNN